MYKVLIFLCWLPVTMLAQNGANLSLSNVEVRVNSEAVFTAVGQNIPLVKSRTSNHYKIFEGQGIRIEAKYKLVSYNSRRSSNKTGAIKLIATYYTYYQGKKDKKRTENVFFWGDTREFSASERFLFKKGINSQLIHLKYNGRLNS